MDYIPSRVNNRKPVYNPAPKNIAPPVNEGGRSFEQWQSKKRSVAKAFERSEIQLKEYLKRAKISTSADNRKSVIPLAYPSSMKHCKLEMVNKTPEIKRPAEIGGSYRKDFKLKDHSRNGGESKQTNKLMGRLASSTLTNSGSIHENNRPHPKSYQKSGHSVSNHKKSPSECSASIGKNNSTRNTQNILQSSHTFIPTTHFNHPKSVPSHNYGLDPKNSVATISKSVSNSLKFAERRKVIKTPLPVSTLNNSCQEIDRKTTNIAYNEPKRSDVPNQLFHSGTNLINPTISRTNGKNMASDAHSLIRTETKLLENEKEDALTVVINSSTSTANNSSTSSKSKSDSASDSDSDSDTDSDSSSIRNFSDSSSGSDSDSSSGSGSDEPTESSKTNDKIKTVITCENSKPYKKDMNSMPIMTSDTIIRTMPVPLSSEPDEITNSITSALPGISIDELKTIPNVCVFLSDDSSSEDELEDDINIKKPNEADLVHQPEETIQSNAFRESDEKSSSQGSVKPIPSLNVPGYSSNQHLASIENIVKPELPENPPLKEEQDTSLPGVKSSASTSNEDVTKYSQNPFFKRHEQIVPNTLPQPSTTTDFEKKFGEFLYIPQSLPPIIENLLNPDILPPTTDLNDPIGFEQSMLLSKNELLFENLNQSCFNVSVNNHDTSIISINSTRLPEMDDLNEDKGKTKLPRASSKIKSKSIKSERTDSNLESSIHTDATIEKASSSTSQGKPSKDKKVSKNKKTSSSDVSSYSTHKSSSSKTSKPSTSCKTLVPNSSMEQKSKTPNTSNSKNAQHRDSKPPKSTYNSSDEKSSPSNLDDSTSKNSSRKDSNRKDLKSYASNSSGTAPTVKSLKPISENSKNLKHLKCSASFENPTTSSGIDTDKPNWNLREVSASTSSSANSHISAASNGTLKLTFKRIKANQWMVSSSEASNDSAGSARSSSSPELTPKKSKHSKSARMRKDSSSSKASETSKDTVAEDSVPKLSIDSKHSKKKEIINKIFFKAALKQQQVM